MAGLFATVTYSIYVKRDAERIAQLEFEHDVASVQQAVIAKLESHRQVLLGTAAMFDASNEVTRDEWRSYTSHLFSDSHFFGIQGVGFAKWFPRGELEQLTNDIQQQGYMGFRVTPETEREWYSSIIYLEPFVGRNLRAFGYDMYSEATRRDAMERARDNNEVTLTGKVVLVQEDGDTPQAGTLMYAPVYRKNTSHDDVEHRRAALTGWVYSPFRMGDLLGAVVRKQEALHSHGINLSVYDGKQEDSNNLLFQSISNRSAKASLHPVDLTMTVGGRDWMLRFSPDITHEAGIDYSEFWGVLGIGGLANALLFFLFSANWRMREALQVAEDAVEELRKSESRFRILAENESVLVWMAGIDKKCNYFNAVWLAFTGRTLEQEMGDGWVDGVHPDDVSRCWDIYSSAFGARSDFTMEYRLRRHDGEYRWIVDHGVPCFNQGGEFAGYIGSCMDITERKLKDRQLQLTQFAMDNSALEVYWLDKHARIHYVNGQACTTLGYTREELVQLSIPDLDPLFPVEQWNDHWEALKRDRTQFFETLHKSKSGALIPVEVWANYVKLDELEYNIAFCRDISKRKQSEERLRKSEAQLRAVLDSVQDFIVELDRDGHILSINHVVPGIDSSQVIGQDFVSWAPPHEHTKMRQCLARVFDTAEPCEYEAQGQGEGDELRWYHSRLSPVLLEGKVERLVLITTDITLRRQAEEQIRNLAFYDPLTQLPNRRLLNDRLTNVIAVTRRSGRYGALLFLDLDNFKPLNDVHGHAVGDQLLVEVAQRLSGCVREVDTVARFGGDEFVVLLNELAEDASSSQSQASIVAEKIRSALSAPYHLKLPHVTTEIEHRCSSSIGVVLFSGHESDPVTILKQGDIAMYRAKNLGRDRIEIYE